MTESSKKYIVVTGSQGQLGRELTNAALLYPQFEYSFLSRDEFPLDDLQKMQDWLDNHPVDILINTAAYTAVDKAESEKEKAFQINATAPGFLANILHKKNALLVHISTDYVFDGYSSTPLKEDATTNPVNIYGASKLEGEVLAVRNNPETVVIRTSWLYSASGHNFVKTMIRLMNERSSINVVDDQIGSPTFAGDLAVTILQMLSSDHITPGIYHYSNEGKASWYQFAIAIKNLISSKCEVIPVPSTSYPTPAKRPQYSLMDKTKIKLTYGLNIPDWQTSLKHCIQIVKNLEV